MYLLLLLLWIIFNGRVTAEILIMGVVICGWLYWFMCKHMGYSAKKEISVLKGAPGMAKYFFILVLEIIKSNLSVIKIILSPKIEIEPDMVEFSSDLREEAARVMLANSITLTPGTYTVQLEDSRFMVHALDKSFGENLNESIFVKQLKKLEEKR